MKHWLTAVVGVTLLGWLLYRSYRGRQRAGIPVGPPVLVTDDVPLPPDDLHPHPAAPAPEPPPALARRAGATTRPSPIAATRSRRIPAGLGSAQRGGTRPAVQWQAFRTRHSDRRRRDEHRSTGNPARLLSVRKSRVDPFRGW